MRIESDTKLDFIMKTKSEILKDIEGWEGRYRVSNLGRIKSLVRSGSGARTVDGFLRPPCGSGYARVFFCKNSVMTQLSVHRLVAIAFVPNPQNKPCVDHINGDKLDNRAENLRWCTHSENSANAKTSKLNTSGIKGISLTKNKHQNAQYWEASVKIKGVRHRVLFPLDEKEKAIEWIQNKREELNGDFAKH